MKSKKLSRTRVKMCGTTRLEDALCAVGLGVDALGFIFYHKSPRNISPAKVSEIIKNLPPFIDCVGVFVNSSATEIQSVAEAGLSYLQLHGEESPKFCREIKAQLPFHKIFKAFRVGSESSAADFSLYNECVDGFLLDTYVKGESGGTGLSFDWSIIEKLELQKPFLLAGGLSVENVSEAIGAVAPYALDVNSGVESAPGVKDHAKIRKFMDIVEKSDFTSR